MPLNKEFYIGTNKNPFIIKLEVLSDGKTYYDIEKYTPGVESLSLSQNMQVK